MGDWVLTAEGDARGPLRMGNWVWLRAGGEAGGEDGGVSAAAGSGAAGRAAAAAHEGAR